MGSLLLELVPNFVYGAIAALVLVFSASGSGPLISQRTHAVVQLGVGLLLLGMGAWRMLRVRAGHRPKLG